MASLKINRSGCTLWLYMLMSRRCQTMRCPVHCLAYRGYLSSDTCLEPVKQLTVILQSD